MFGLDDYEPYLPSYGGFDPVNHQGLWNRQYNPDTFERPSNFYRSTVEYMYRPTEDNPAYVEYDQRMGVLYQCDECPQIGPYQAFQIDHTEDWEEFVRSTQPETEAEATQAYNDVNNLRLLCTTCNADHNASHDREDEDDYDYDDPFIDDSGDGDIMSTGARQGLDEFKFNQASYFRQGGMGNGNGWGSSSWSNNSFFDDGGIQPMDIDAAPAQSAGRASSADSAAFSNSAWTANDASTAMSAGEAGGSEDALLVLAEAAEDMAPLVLFA